jgi:hypothetical protein
MLRAILQALALLLDRSKLTPSGTEYAEHFLKERVARIETDAWMKEFMEDSVTGAKTFDELLKFRKRHEAEIATVANAYRRKSD